MIKLKNAYMPLISIVMTIALLLTLGFTGYFTMQPVCADDDPAAEIFSCDAEPLISSIEYSGDKCALSSSCLHQCRCSKIQLEKTGPPEARVNEEIEYTFKVTNTHVLTFLRDVTITDAKLLDKDIEVGNLGPQQTKTVTAKYIVKEADKPTLVNNATVTAYHYWDCQHWFPLTCSATCTVKIVDPNEPNPSITLTKTPSVSSAKVGDKITYSYTITNNGNTPLTNIVLTDDKKTDANGQITLSKTELAAGGDPITAIWEYTVLPTDPNPVTNKAIVTGTYEGTKVSKEASASVTIQTTPSSGASIKVTKTADRSSAYNGDTIHYNYTVTNNGDTPLHNVTLVDNKLGSVTLTATTLAVGAQASGTSEFNVTSSTPRGDLTNTATAKGYYYETGTDQKEGYVEDVASKTVQILSPSGGGGGGGGGSALSAQITVDKTADKSTAAAGDTITYTYKIKNNGDYSFSKVELDDNKLGKKTLGTLNAGDSTTVTDTYTVKDSDPVGELKNIVTVRGFYNRYGYESQVSATDEAVVTIISKPEAIVAATEPVVAEPIQIPPEPQAELPYTGGDALLFGLAGVVMICMGIAVSRRLAA